MFDIIDAWCNHEVFKKYSTSVFTPLPPQKKKTDEVEMIIGYNLSIPKMYV